MLVSLPAYPTQELVKLLYSYFSRILPVKLGLFAYFVNGVVVEVKNLLLPIKFNMQLFFPMNSRFINANFERGMSGVGKQTVSRS